MVKVAKKRFEIMKSVADRYVSDRAIFIGLPDRERAIKQVIQYGYLVFITQVLTGDRARADFHGRQLAADAVELLFGPWRALPTPSEPAGLDPIAFRASFVWVHEFRECLMAAAVVGDWEGASRIAEYAAAGDLPAWPTVHEIMSGDNAAYYEELSGMLLGREDVRRRAVRLYSRRPSKRVVLLRECLAALDEGTPPSFLKALRHYLAHYERPERDPEIMVEELSVDGSLLFAFGRKRYGDAPMNAALADKAFDRVASL